MNPLEPLRIQQINLNQMVYTKIKDEPSKNKKIVHIKYQNNKPFVFQCPALLNENLPVKITDDYYELEIPLITQDENKQSKFKEFLSQLDKKINQDASKNGKMWFNEHSKTYTLKTIIKESDVHKQGVIKIKIIKTPSFETLLLLDNKRRISIKDIPKNSWVKMLLEVFTVVINTENNSFYLFLRPIALSFKEKEATKYNYKFLEDSESDEDGSVPPDTEVNDIFLKQTDKDEKNELVSSQINIIDKNVISNLSNLKVTSTNNFSNSSSTSSEKRQLESSSSSTLEELNEKDEDSSSEELKKISLSSSEEEIQENFLSKDDNIKSSSSSTDSELIKKLSSDDDNDTITLTNKLIKRNN